MSIHSPASALALPSRAISSSFFLLVCAPVKKTTRQAVAAMKDALKMSALRMFSGGSAVAGARSASITVGYVVRMRGHDEERQRELTQYPEEADDVSTGP